MDDAAGQVAVSRRIAASASDIFQVLIDPASHLAMDGSGMVTEIYDCSGVADDDRLSMDNGRIWIEAMAKTLERLDHLCTG